MHVKCGYKVMCLFLQEQPKLIHLSEDRLCTFVLEMLVLLGGNGLSRTSYKIPIEALRG